MYISVQAILFRRSVQRPLSGCNQRRVKPREKKMEYDRRWISGKTDVIAQARVGGDRVDVHKTDGQGEQNDT